MCALCGMGAIEFGQGCLKLALEALALYAQQLSRSAARIEATRERNSGAKRGEHERVGRLRDCPQRKAHHDWGKGCHQGERDSPRLSGRGWRSNAHGGHWW